MSIGIGMLATLIFLGDLALLARKELQRRRALRQPPPEYGALDYEPEFHNAIQRYVQAEKQIQDATNRTTEVFQSNQALNSQQEADECGAAAKELCQEYEERLPEMRESGEISRTCLKGFLKTSQLTSKADAEELLALREGTRGARKSTARYLQTIKEGKKTTEQLRNRNISRSLNESSVRLQAHLGDAAGIIRSTTRGLAAAERHMTRRLLWYSMRVRLTPMAVSRGEKSI